MPLLRGILVCTICDRLVSLETCKIDEDGRAVHQGCYVLRTLQRSRREQVPGLLFENDRRKPKSVTRKPNI